MRIAVVNQDTRLGPNDAREGRFGAAQLCPEYLARALVARGHEVVRLSPHVWTDDAFPPGVEYRPLSDASREPPFDAAIATRYVWLLDGVNAVIKVVWVHDQHGHSGAHFERYPDVRVVTVSRYLTGEFQRQVADRDVMAVIPCGVPDELFSYPIEPGLRLYACGMWVECRGTLEAIKAFKRTRDAVPGLTLELFGDSHLWDCKVEGYGLKVQDAAREAGALVHGTISHPEMLAALRSVNVLLHPATSETCGVAVLEAMAAGNVVLTTGCGALREINLPCRAHGTSAWGDNERQLIAEYTNDPSLYRDHAAHNRVAARPYAWSEIAKRWEGALT